MLRITKAVISFFLVNSLALSLNFSNASAAEMEVRYAINGVLYFAIVAEEDYFVGASNDGDQAQSHSGTPSEMSSTPSYLESNRPLWFELGQPDLSGEK